MSNTANPEIRSSIPVNQRELTGVSSPNNRLSADRINRFPGGIHILNMLTALGVAIGTQASRPNEVHASPIPITRTASVNTPDSLYNVKSAPDSAPEFQSYERKFKWVKNPNIPPGGLPRIQEETNEADRFLSRIADKIDQVQDPELSSLLDLFRDQNDRNRLNPGENPALIQELRLRESSLPKKGNSPFRYSLEANDQIAGDGGIIFATFIEFVNTQGREEFGSAWINDVMEFYLAMEGHKRVFNDVQEMVANGTTPDEINAAKVDLYAKHVQGVRESSDELLVRIMPQLASLGLKIKSSQRPTSDSQNPAS